MDAPGPDAGFSRRQFLHAALWSVAALTGLALTGAHPVAASVPVPPGAVGPPALVLDGNPRFQFQPITPVSDQLRLGSLHDVWASSNYITYTDCVVTYVGGGDFVLTGEEQAIVDVIAQAGGDVSDGRVAYLTAVAASTRMDPRRLAARLAELGAPIIRGSLALAPDAPQARLFLDWLSANG